MQLILFLLIQIKFFSNALMGPNVRAARDGEYTFVVAIKRINRDNPTPETDFINTGTLITNFLVLTSVNGVQQVNVRTLEVLYNLRDLRSNHRRRIRWFMSYNEWADERHLPAQPQVDMGVLRLSNEVNIQPVVISALTRDQAYRLNVVTVGWGLNGEGHTPRMMQVLPLKILRKKQCKDRAQEVTGRNNTIFHRKYLCSATRQPSYIRQGDNGGPVLRNGELIAINKGCCPANDNEFHARRFNLHTSIDEFRNFINDVLEHW